MIILGLSAGSGSVTSPEIFCASGFSESIFGGSSSMGLEGDPPKEKLRLDISLSSGFMAGVPNEILAFGVVDNGFVPNLKPLFPPADLSAAPKTKLGFEAPKLNPVGFFSPIENPEDGFDGSLGALPVPNWKTGVIFPSNGLTGRSNE